MAKRYRNSQNCAKPYVYFHADTSQGWRILRRLSYGDGMRGVQDGLLRRVLDSMGRLIGFQQIRYGDPDNRDVKKIAPMKICSAISARENELNAGTAFRAGGSRTAKMSEMQRGQRIHSKTGDVLPAEDSVERAVAKVAAWQRPSITDRLVSA